VDIATLNMVNATLPLMGQGNIPYSFCYPKGKGNDFHIRLDSGVPTEVARETLSKLLNRDTRDIGTLKPVYNIAHGLFYDVTKFMPPYMVEIF